MNDKSLVITDIELIDIFNGELKEEVTSLGIDIAKPVFYDKDGYLRSSRRIFINLRVKEKSIDELKDLKSEFISALKDKLVAFGFSAIYGIDLESNLIDQCYDVLVGGYIPPK